MNEFIVLSKNQRDWMRRVMKNMVELTAYYSFAGQPLKETDYENIAGAFSNYTRKSKNNAMIIKSAVAMSAYLDGIVGQENKLDKGQMRMLEEVVTELFDVTDQYQEQVVDEAQQKEAIARIDMCGQALGEHVLPKEMKDIFKAYLLFCGKNMKKQTLSEFGVLKKELPEKAARRGR